MGVLQFVDDDDGYLDWITRNPVGFVIQCRRTPTPDHLIIHEATCILISALPSHQSTLTADYRKIVATDPAELLQWSFDQTGSRARSCGSCLPRSISRRRGRPPKSETNESTVWELLRESVRTLPEPFGRQAVLSWFSRHYPDVLPQTISAHMQFATSNAPTASRAGFARRTPLVTRIGRGEYIRYRDPAAPDPPRPSTPTRLREPLPSNTPGTSELLDGQYDVALVGCGRAKRGAPSPAADLYTSGSFRNRRRLAERRGRDWFVLSAEYGLVAPDEWLTPYDLKLDETSPEYQEAWGSWVVARLQRRLGSLRDRTILVLAPGAYARAIIGRLLECDARVSWPLAGLAMGQQGAWVARELDLDDAGAPAQFVPTQAAVGHSKPVDRTAIAAALLAFREADQQRYATRLGYAQTEAADQLLLTDPFAFLLGVLLDEGIPAERAWQGPYELRARLGHLDPQQIRYDLRSVSAAVDTQPKLHRFVDVMARAIVAAADRVCREYDGDAAQIWSPGSTAAEVDARLRAFDKIGPKKAAMAVELLVSHFGVELEELSGSNVAYDVHVRRVFLRTGLVDRDSINEVTRAARELWPERPGLLDLPTWLIGRQWCHSANPTCSTCPLGQVCPRLTERNLGY